MPSMLSKLITGLSLVLGIAASPLYAQSTEADIKARLKDKPLYLKGFWRDDYLHFDGDGKLIGASAPISFTLSGFELERVYLKKGKLGLDGKRVGVEFEKGTPKRISMEKISIDIDSSSSGDFSVALDAIFVDGLPALAPLLPSYWRAYAKCKLIPQPEQPTEIALPTNCHEPIRGTAQVGGVVKPPRIIQQVNADFNDYAKKQKYGGSSTVSFVVKADGLPSRLSIISPLGLGLDEQALAAASRYVFTPALRGDKPVAVQTNLEVVFHIY